MNDVVDDAADTHLAAGQWYLELRGKQGGNVGVDSRLERARNYMQLEC